EEAALADAHAARVGDRDPAARLEQRAVADRQAPVVERLEHVPLHREAHEEAAAHGVQVDARLPDRAAVALVPLPLLGPELGLGVVHAAAATFLERPAGARRLPPRGA